jgi:hypothetical protein
MQLEVLLLAVLPVAFFFAVWKGAHSIAEKSTVISQALGFEVDLGVYYDQFRPYVFFSAGIFSITLYFKARRWIQRKISACLA